MRVQNREPDEGWRHRKGLLEEECLNLMRGSRGGYLAERWDVEAVTGIGRAHRKSRALSKSWREPGW